MHTMEEKEVIVVGGEWDVLGLLGSQGSHDRCCKGGADVKLGAGQCSLTPRRARRSATWLTSSVRNFQRIPASGFPPMSANMLRPVQARHEQSACMCVTEGTQHSGP